MKKAILIGLGITALAGIAYAVMSGGCPLGVCEPGCCWFC
jgi:hypothetical protein